VEEWRSGGRWGVREVALSRDLKKYRWQKSGESEQKAPEYKGQEAWPSLVAF
jgi:hypothetical protein